MVFLLSNIDIRAENQYNEQNVRRGSNMKKRHSVFAPLHC